VSGENVPLAILAGGSAGSLAQAQGVGAKALVQIEGRPMLDWVLDAVEEAGEPTEIVIVEGPDRPISRAGQGRGVEVVAASGTGFLDSLTAAASAFPDAGRLFVATGDLPLLTDEAVDGFIRSCHNSQAELLYPIVQAEQLERAFPGRGKTTVRLREGRFTGGNLAALSRRFILQQGPTIAETFARRKSPLGMCRLFGWGFVLRLVLGRLSVADLEDRGTQMLGAELEAVPVEWPGIGFDVDDAEDLELARRYLRKRRS